MEIRSARTDEIDAIRELLAQCGLPVEDVSASAPIRFLVAVVSSECAIAGCVGLETYEKVGLLIHWRLPKVLEGKRLELGSLPLRKARPEQGASGSCTCSQPRRADSLRETDMR